MNTRTKAALGVLSLASLAAGQQAPVEVHREVRVIGPHTSDVTVTRPAGSPVPDVMPFAAAPFGDTIHFLSADMMPGEGVKKGAPYSAEAVSETVQTLLDGTRITRKNTATVHRDGEGRTRREQTMVLPGGEQHSSIFLNDPVAHVHTVLHPEVKTANRMRLPELPHGAGANRVFMGAAPGRRVHIVTSGGPGDSPERRTKVEADIGQALSRVHKASGAVTSRTEALGKQSMEGVEVEGTRTVNTIPVNEIGNDRPIEIVMETWRSPELGVVVMSRVKDPRMGESTYRLTNLRRQEPLRSLFEVPADYTVREMSPDVRILRDKVEGQRQ